MIGIFGGTFNPIHTGHCRSAIELIDCLGLEKMHVVPCGLPPHRETPKVDAVQRLAMVQAAFAGESKITIDECELRRQGPSYSLDTVKLLREQYNKQPIILIIGDDAFRSFDSWHEWQSILNYVHIVIMTRPHLPGKTDTAMSVELKKFLEERLTDAVAALKQSPAGSIYYQEVTQIDISATKIRDDIAAGKNIRYLVPDGVMEIIKNCQLYL